MMSDQSGRASQNLVAALAAELEPVSFWQRPRTLLFSWLLLSLLVVVVMSLAYAPWRPGVLKQLVSAPRFALEIALALGGMCTLAWVAVQSAVPGALRSARIPVILALAWAPWLVLLFLGLYEPALPPSMTGKRADCYLEVIVESLPPLILGLLLLRRLYPLRGFRSGMLVGTVAGMVPALLMQLSCMYLVEHAWSHHLAPVLVPVLFGALAGGVLFRR